MMRLFLALCMLCLAGVASAQTVVVRSGEHGTFTRLTLDLPSRAEWRLEPKPGGARIVFPGSDVDFDITRVFDRINRNRLRAIAPERGRLDLGFACDCLGSSFKCNTQSPLGIGCCDGHTKQAPQQRGTWRDISRA
jgi:hypothetical protein